MAVNTFDALMAEVNKAITETTTATSEANAAAANAEDKAVKADDAAQNANAAAETANTAAQGAADEAAAWEGAMITTTTVDSAAAADVSLTEVDGKKNFAFKVPRGKAGAAGEKGDTGRSGVSFSLSGSRLYITTG